VSENHINKYVILLFYELIVEEFFGKRPMEDSLALKIKLFWSQTLILCLD